MLDDSHYNRGMALVRLEPVDEWQKRVLYLVLRHKANTGEYPRKIVVGHKVADAICPEGCRWIKMVLPEDPPGAVKMIDMLNGRLPPVEEMIVETVQLEVDTQPYRLELGG